MAGPGTAAWWGAPVSNVFPRTKLACLVLLQLARFPFCLFVFATKTHGGIMHFVLSYITLDCTNDLFYFFFHTALLERMRFYIEDCCLTTQFPVSH